MMKQRSAQKLRLGLFMGLLVVSPPVFAQADWFDALDQQFETTFTQTDAAFDRAMSEGIQELDRELSEIWGQARALPQAKKWVGYSEDKSRRIIVDYDKGEISVEGIDLDQSELMSDFQDILLEPAPKLDERARLKKKILDKTRDFWDDPVVQDRRKRAFAPLRNPRGRSFAPETRKEWEDRNDLKAREEGEKHTYAPARPEREKREYAKPRENRKNLAPRRDDKPELAQLVAPKAKPVFISRSAFGKAGKPISFGKITIPMRKDRVHLSAQALMDPIDRAVEKYNLPRSLILSVIKNESSFNPRALSPAKAMGLMQLVPTSGGKEAYTYLLGREATPGPDVLYDPVENIMLGSTYLYLLKTRYFGRIKNAETRRHLIIAAYNTGAGNVAKAFTGAMKLRPAIDKINTMSPDQVFKHLQAHLPYDETKTYLARVSRDLQTFAEWDETA